VWESVVKATQVTSSAREVTDLPSRSADKLQVHDETWKNKGLLANEEPFCMPTLNAPDGSVATYPC